MRYLFCLFLFFVSNLQAQQRFYFVAFKDKPNYKIQLYNPISYISARAIERRSKNRVPLNENDIPPDSIYLAKLSAMPLTMYGNSRWLNGTVIISEAKNLVDTLKQLSFVKSVTYLGPAFPEAGFTENNNSDLENQLNQLQQNFNKQKNNGDTLLFGRSQTQIKLINDERLMAKGLGGQNVLIAVIDAGFRNIDKLQPFAHLLKERRILAAYDFVEKEEEVFENDDHGLAVLSCLAANQPGFIMGTAPHAQFLLLRSENASAEYLVEEYFWTLAAEYADSAGADIINSSLGYTKHDEKGMGHTYSDLDGRTTIVTRAAEIAASKGILVVASAGNEGDDPWKQLSAPGDGAHVLTVGAVDKFGAYAGFSSLGPSADRRMKPDLTAMGKGAVLLSADGKIFEGNGTSYSCPIVAGAAAQLMELAPNSSAEKIKEALLLSCPQYYKPDKFLGAGIPDMELAAGMVQARIDSVLDIRELADQNLHVLIHSRSNQRLTLWIKEPMEGDIEKFHVNVKKGLNRTQLKGYKKRPGGLYHLSVDFPGKRSELDFMKP